jgi:hypothetical protein
MLETKTYKNIYLISNDCSASEKLFDLPEDSDNNLLVLFNHCYPLRYQKIKDYPNKILFLRSGAEKPYGYHGAKEYIEYIELFKKVYFIATTKNSDFPELTKLCPSYNIIKIFVDIPYFANKNYPIDRHPTSGFVGFHYISENYQFDEITLVNFNGGASGDGIPWNKHDYVFEQQFYKQQSAIQRI